MMGMLIDFCMFGFLEIKISFIDCICFGRGKGLMSQTSLDDEMGK